MKVKWVGVLGLAMMLSVIWGGTVFYVFKDRLVLSPVVVTVKAIPECSPIQSSDVKVIELPRMGIPPGTARSLKDVDNLWTNCGYAIPKNGFIYLSHVASSTSITARLEPNERRVTIPVDQSTLMGGRIHQGDRLDIWFISKRQTNGAFVGKLFSDIEVVEIQDSKGNRMGTDNQAEPELRKGLLSFTPIQTASLPAFLTLRLKEADIPYLLSARQEGTLVIVESGQSIGKDIRYSENAKEWLKARWLGKEAKS